MLIRKKDTKISSKLQQRLSALEENTIYVRQRFAKVDAELDVLKSRLAELEQQAKSTISSQKLERIDADLNTIRSEIAQCKFVCDSLLFKHSEFSTTEQQAMKSKVDIDKIKPPIDANNEYVLFRGISNLEVQFAIAYLLKTLGELKI